MSTIDDYADLRDFLKQSADDKYRDFSMKICTSKHPFWGVRVPQIRKYANQVSAAYEEVLLRGFLIARLPYDRMLKYFDSQLKYIDDWSTCDLFCSAIGKTVKKNKDEFIKKKIQKLLDSKHEFITRIGLVLLKCCYIESTYLKYIFAQTDRLSSRDEYYVKMALAWLISECFIKYPSETMDYLSKSEMPAWTFNKTISKICDSYRIDTEMKKTLKKMRK